MIVFMSGDFNIPSDTYARYALHPSELLSEPLYQDKCTTKRSDWRILFVKPLVPREKGSR